jgi:type 1 glutamine amidotransferase
MDSYRVDVSAPEHPVCRGVEAFDVDDELYLCPVFEDRVQPLLTTPADVSAASTIDTYREVRDGVHVAAQEQPSSNLVGWLRTEGGSRIVYLLPGHGPSTMGHPQYRRLIVNACGWVAGSTVRR